MIKFTAEDIPRGWQSDKKEKVYAEFDDSGALTHYGLYDGLHAKHCINIDHDNLTAQLDEYKRSDFKPKGDDASGQQLLTWVKKWIDKIENRTPPQCSFCGGLQDKDRKVIAGPRHYICNECLDICKDTIAQSAASKA